jgi:hypothetical protein
VSRKVRPFEAPAPRRSHGLSQAAFLATRLSEASSMVFGFAVLGDSKELGLACEKAQIALDRIKTLIRKEAHE